MRRILFVLLLTPLVFVQAQSKPAPTPADYGKWETLVSPPRFGGGASSSLSPDGKWLAYGINRSNGNNELRITNIADGSVKTAAFGAQTAFSADSKWVAYSMGYSEAQQDKMRKDRKPIQNKLGLMNLTTGEQTTIDGVASFAFSPTGTWLAMRRYPPEKPGATAGADAAAGGGRGGRGGAGGGGDDADDENPVGATLIVRQLSTGRDTTLATSPTTSGRTRR
jgi:hypothetical protein